VVSVVSSGEPITPSAPAPVRVTVMPLTPGSPGSWTPSPFSSRKTLSPRDARSLTIPASMDVLSSPGERVTTGVVPSVVSASLSNVSSVPASGVVNPVLAGRVLGSKVT